MIHSAADLFPDWYTKGVNKDVSSDELALRRNAISEFLKITDKSKWVSLLKVYLGLKKLGSIEYNDIVGYIRLGDENFQVQNENVTRVISGCIIGQKIDENKSYISDILALGIICSELLPSVNSPIPDLFNRSVAFWRNECEEKRKINLDFQVNTPITSSPVKVEIPELSADQTTWKANSDAVIKIIKALQKDLTDANAQIISQQSMLKTIKQNFIALAEESDVLWWLFGGYSSTLKKGFGKMQPDLLSIIISLELSKLTRSCPGIGGIESIINKALSNVEYENGSQHSLENIIDSIKDSQVLVKDLLPNTKLELEPFTPIVNAIKCRNEYAGNEWKAIYQKHNETDLAIKLTFESFSFYLYKELMLINVYNN